jgi:Flp pilus assembly protein CpaB
MVVAGLLAFLLAYAALRDRSSVFDVVIAAEDIPAGVAVEPGLFSAVSLRLSNGALPDSLLTKDEAVAAAARGVRFSSAVPSGSVLRSSDIALPGQLRDRAMAFPVDRAHAVDGALGPGDVIDIVQVSDGVAGVVLSAVPLIAVSEEAFGGARGLTLTVEVNAARSLRLAQAIAAGGLVIVRATGAKPIEAASGPLLPVGGVGSG